MNLQAFRPPFSAPARAGDQASAPASVPLVWPARYPLLGGFRGLAALLVVMHHVGIVAFGHYAVMIFFVISGYCITASAHACLAQGLSFGSFMARRIRRIYPPYLFAVLFFAATRVAKYALGDHSGAHHSVVDWVQNLTLTQWLTLLLHPMAEAAQNPTLLVSAFWSLNYEEQFYLLMALALLLARRTGQAIVTPLLLLAVAGMAWNLAFPDGWICGLFIEYWLHFAIGAALFTVLCRCPRKLWRRAFVGTLLALGGTSLYQVASSHLAGLNPPRVYAELAVVSPFALLLLLLRPHAERIGRSLPWRPVAALGTMSYSLYLVHQFNLSLAAGLAARVLPAHPPQPLLLALTVAVHVGIAALFWRWCERPFLNRGARSEGAQPAAVEHAASPVP